LSTISFSFLLLFSLLSFFLFLALHVANSRPGARILLEKYLRSGSINSLLLENPKFHHRAHKISKLGPILNKPRNPISVISVLIICPHPHKWFLTISLRFRMNSYFYVLLQLLATLKQQNCKWKDATEYQRMETI
jgi:hypothetical protein